MINIDTYAYSNRLKTVHPAEKFIFAMITLIVCLTSPTVITSLTVLALMAGGIIIKTGISGRFFVQKGWLSPVISLPKKREDLFSSITTKSERKLSVL